MAKNRNPFQLTSSLMTMMTPLMRFDLPSLYEICDDYDLWTEHADPGGMLSEEQFCAMSFDDRLDLYHCATER